jgi:type I restriction enzyme S subunit
MNLVSMLLSELATVYSGGGAPQNAAAFSRTGCPFIRAGSLPKLLDGATEESLELIEPEIAKQYGLTLFPASTVLFAKSGMSATKGHIYRLKSPAYVVSHLAALVPHKATDSAFLVRALQRFSPTVLVKDPAYPSIRLSDIKAMRIKAPASAKERERIAMILDTADALRVKRRAALIQIDALTHSVFLDLFGDSTTRTKKFPSAPLGAVTKFIDYRGISPNKQSSGIRLVTAKNIKRGWFEEEPQEFIPSDEYATWMRRGIPRTGDVLFTTEGHTLGSAAQLPDFEKAALAQRLIALQTGEQLSPEYLLQIILSREFQSEVFRRATGSAARGISSKALAEISVAVPPLDLQRHFSRHVATLEKLKKTELASLRQLDALFASLQHQAFHGLL